jgi:hypothetical protein
MLEGSKAIFANATSNVIIEGYNALVIEELRVVVLANRSCPILLLIRGTPFGCSQGSRSGRSTELLKAAHALAKFARLGSSGSVFLNNVPPCLLG